jgi:DNA invertase Pin-like site-specific DNA recombinase
MTTIGYARVSTDEQTLDAQQAALQSAGCERVFAEKQSGAKTDRAALAKAIASLSQRDTLVVCKLDQLVQRVRMGVLCSHQGSPSDRKVAPASAIAARVLSKSRVDLASLQ